MVVVVVVFAVMVVGGALISSSGYWSGWVRSSPGHGGGLCSLFMRYRQTSLPPTVINDQYQVGGSKKQGTDPAVLADRPDLASLIGSTFLENMNCSCWLAKR